METKISNIKVANMRLPRILLLSLFIGSLLGSVGISYFTESKSKEYVRENSYLTDLKRYVLDLDNVHNQLEILKPQLGANKNEATKATLTALSQRREELGKQLKAFVRGPEYVRLALQIETLSQNVFAEYLNPVNADKKLAKEAKQKATRQPASQNTPVTGQYHETTKKLIANINEILIFKSATRAKYLAVYNALSLVFALLASFCGLVMINRLFRLEKLLKLKQLTKAN